MSHQDLPQMPEMGYLDPLSKVDRVLALNQAYSCIRSMMKSDLKGDQRVYLDCLTIVNELTKRTLSAGKPCGHQPELETE